MIVCRNITKIYAEHLVLDDCSYHFDDTGFYLLLGESGSGKTTFLNILSGFLPFEGGRITWNGTVFTKHVDTALVEKDFDYITQDAFFVEFLSVMDNMRLVCDHDETILERLRVFGLEQTVEQLPGTLSGGERQRLAIVRALLNNKKVLFLDEPTAALDEENKTKVFELLAELKQQVLIICATHDEQAIAYADDIIHFSKIRKRAEGVCAASDQKEEITAVKEKENTAEKTDAARFLKKWFISEHRNRWAMLLFTIFLVLSLGLCVFSDLPDNKWESTVENIYKLNMFTVETWDQVQWKDIVPDENGICEVVLDYGYTCPDGNEALDIHEPNRTLPEWEISLHTLPFNKEAFRLSDKIKYGTYFTAEDQIILSWEMAKALYPSHPEKMVGQHISKNIYSLGWVDFEIVGIFDEFNDAEKVYLQALGVDILCGSEYKPEYYEDLYFINSKLTAKLEEDDGFYGGTSAQRGYLVFFESYQDMKKYYDAYNKSLQDNGNVYVYYSTINLGLHDALKVLFYITLPVSFFMIVFATLFYISLKKTEYVYSCQFVAVFEYADYSKKKVINQFIGLNILELIKMYVAALAITIAIACAVNWVNSRYIFVNFQIFTFNPLMLLLVLLFMLAVSVIYSNVIFHSVKVSTWYENLIQNRDLI